MKYEETAAYLLDIPKFAKKNTLEDTKSFLHRLGNPGCGETVIHIAGTNGKGSVCAYLSSVLQKAGYRVGMFTSPHLVSMCERFRINGKQIRENEFVDCFTQVRDRLAGDSVCSAYHPSFFEMLFFMAMLYFETQQAEVILLETGLGGRLDATNSVSGKALCIITEIGYDHMEYLGGTLGEIAGEKAGILQKNVPLVFWDGKKEASEIITERAKRLGCPVSAVSKRDIRNFEIHKKFIDFSFQTGYYGYIRCSLTTYAPYQAMNAALVLAALDVLHERLPVDPAAITAGMKEARWEGRMEELLPDVIVDGAHNRDGVLAFLDAVRADNCTGRRFLLFSAVTDKQYEEMAEALTGSRLFERIYVTELKNTRGVSCRLLRAAFGAGGAAGSFTDAGQALEALLRSRVPGDRIYIAGSLYLAGEIKHYIAESHII